MEVRNVNGSVASGAVLNISLDTNTSKVDTVKLGELSTIEGFVFLGKSAPLIRVAGLDRYVVPDSTGHFVIDSLPVGDFDVQIGDPQEVYSAKVQSTTGDTLYVDCSDSTSSINVVKPKETAASEYPDADWNEHDALIKLADGYAVGVLGAAGVLALGLAGCGGSSSGSAASTAAATTDAAPAATEAATAAETADAAATEAAPAR